LDRSQQQQYIIAVQCLMQKPSVVEPGTYLYDDFAYTHVQDGAKSHYAGAFLAWHRYFIHLYEKALIEQCGLTIPLPYWDWSLDSTDLSASPIWNNLTGFGGNGDLSGDITLYGGRCVADGPFAHTWRHWLYQQLDENDWILLARPHCLSRGFKKTEHVDDLQSRVSPDQIEETLQQQNYTDFFNRLEISTHNAIPQFIMGDFYSFTAPNDPVFYLHHTQVDRLWWMWQQQDPEHRLHEFSGPKETFMHMDNRESSLDDILYAGTVGKNIQVRDVMSTDTSLLCYNY
jgi:tyrosinase